MTGKFSRAFCCVYTEEVVCNTRRQRGTRTTRLTATPAPTARHCDGFNAPKVMFGWNGLPIMFAVGTVTLPGPFRVTVML